MASRNNKANTPGIAGVGSGEVGGGPALNGVAHVLTAGDEDGKDDEQHDGVDVVHAVHPVVVGAARQPREVGEA